MRKQDMKKIILIALLTQGCTSNVYLGESELAKSQEYESKSIVYVTNSDHKNYAIL